MRWEEKGHATRTSDWEMIRRIKASLGIPVIANGGIALPEDIERCLATTGVDAVMTSEMSLCRPDVFRAVGSPRLPVDAMVARYTELVAKYESVVHMPYKPCRAHLFKLLFPALQMHQDCRVRLVDATTCSEMRLVAEELASRKWEDALLAKDPESWLTASWYWRYREGRLGIDALFASASSSGDAASSSSSSSSSSSLSSASEGRSAKRQRELMPGVIEECERAADALKAAEASGANNKTRGQLKRKLVKAEKRKRKAMRKLANLEDKEDTAIGSVVVFDCDGTLSDSLPPHIEFCRRMSEKFELGIPLPEPHDLKACRRLAAAPMARFLEKAGFPATSIPGCVSEYEESFATDHPVKPFTGVAEMLKRLQTNGVQMAVVSSNTSVNVRAALGEGLCALFVSILGIDNGPASKMDAIPRALKDMGVDPDETPVVYVGDTRKDAECAVSSGCKFIGVNYGFEDLSDVSFPVASTVSDLEERLLQQGRGVASISE